MNVIKGDGIITEKLYKNKNGNMNLIDFVKLIHTGEIDQWMRKHNTTIHQCPPKELLKGRECSCFYCVSCSRYAMSKVKKHKTYYQVGKEKFTKEELTNENR